MALRVSMPAIAMEVNEDQSLALVVPAYRERVMGQDRVTEFEDMQPIADVPIAHYSSNKGYVLTKVEAGCHGEIHFCDFDLQNYIESGEIFDVKTRRFHHYSDCFFVPGGFSYARRIDPIDADVAIASIDGLNCVAIKEGGIVDISAATQLNLNAPMVTLNGIAFTSMNPIFNAPIFGTATPVVPGVPKEPKQVRR